MALVADATAGRPALTVQPFVDPPTGTITYLLADEASRLAAVIDAVLDYDPQTGEARTTAADLVLGVLEVRGLSLAYLLETHLHADHLTAAAYLRSRTGAPIVIGRGTAEMRFEGFDRLVGQGDLLPLGAHTIEVMATPGHTACAVAYRIADMVFVGDTLLMPDIGTGRADFPGADARALYRSAHAILSLPAQTRVLVGHDYPPSSRGQLRWEATVAEHRGCNVLVRHGVSEAEFVAARTRRDRGLAPPKLFDVAVAANLRAGAAEP